MPSASVWLHGVRIAETLFGNAQAMNTLLLGLAWQRGLVPVGEAAILRAIELNGAAVATESPRLPVGPHPRRPSELADEILRPTERCRRRATRRN